MSNRIKHANTGHCIIPETQGDNSKLTLSSNCKATGTIFQHTSNKALKHVETGSCIHSDRGVSNPPVGHQFGIFPNCANVPRLRFFTGEESEYLLFA